MKDFAKLKELVAATEADAIKFFERDNSAAGTRLRQSMQQLKGLAQAIRNEVTAKKKAAK
jgi:hypothetical protein